MSRARILADYVSSGDELADKAPLASPTFTGTVAIPNVANLETAVTANTAKTGITSGQASAITANTAKVTNYNQTLADINALDVTELGTVTSGTLGSGVAVAGYTPVKIYGNKESWYSLNTNGETYVMNGGAQNPSRTIKGIYATIDWPGRINGPSGPGAWQTKISLSSIAVSTGTVTTSHWYNNSLGFTNEDAHGNLQARALGIFSGTLGTGDTYTVTWTIYVENNWQVTTDYGIWSCMELI